MIEPIIIRFIRLAFVVADIFDIFLGGLESLDYQIEVSLGLVVLVIYFIIPIKKLIFYSIERSKIKLKQFYMDIKVKYKRIKNAN